MKDAALFFADFLVDRPANRLAHQRPLQLPRAGRPGHGARHGPSDRPLPLRRTASRPPGSWIPTPISPPNCPTCVAVSPRTRSANTVNSRNGWKIKTTRGTSIATSRISGGVYPGCDITWKDEKFFNAARQSLVFRGDAATGWSMGWKVNFWARFLDGDHAYLILRNLLGPVGRGQGRPVCQPVRRPSSIPDRREFRCLRRDRRDADAEPHRRNPPVAGPAPGLADGIGPGPAGAGRLRGGRRLERRPTDRRHDP